MTEDRFPAKTRTTFLIPAYNDWKVLELLVRKLDEILPPACLPVRLLILDDASATPPGPGLGAARFENISSLEIVRLRRNLGHQRAIAIGLAYIYEAIRTDQVIVMDADGEDRPEDVLLLLEGLERSGGNAIIFAERQRRFEPLWFRLFYQLYRQVHRLLTGIPVKVGNFSVIPFRLLGSLVIVSELWSHYAAAVFKSRIRYEAVPTTRGKRLTGKSKMNFVSLVTHGLAAVSVFGETVGVRILMSTFVLMVLVGVTLLLLFAAPITMDVPLPGWAIAVTAFVLLVMSQAFTIAAGSLFFILYARNQFHFVPLRDYRNYIEDAET